MSEKKESRRSKPMRQPRYDEIFYEGMAIWEANLNESDPSSEDIFEEMLFVLSPLEHREAAATFLDVQWESVTHYFSSLVDCCIDDYLTKRYGLFRDWSLEDKTVRVFHQQCVCQRSA